MNRIKLIEQMAELIKNELSDQKKEQALNCLDIINKTFKEPEATLSVKCRTCGDDPANCRNCGAKLYLFSL